MDKIKEISIIKEDIEELSKLIDDLEINIIENNIKNNKKIDLFKLMLENIIIEHHNICKTILK
jgi:predicted pyridoxine 5'-phosphate oxidase superfamily flavin-nucleotide-binding protein